MFVDCTKRYTEHCFEESKRRVFNKAVENSIELVHQMCTSPQYQTGYYDGLLNVLNRAAEPDDGSCVVLEVRHRIGGRGVGGGGGGGRDESSFPYT